MNELLKARQRTQAPTTFERRLGLTLHQNEGGFSIGTKTRAAPSYDPRRNDRSNAHLPKRHYWLGGAGSAPADWFVKFEKKG
jgi:hypothetical protein